MIAEVPRQSNEVEEVEGALFSSLGAAAATRKTTRVTAKIGEDW